MHSQRLSFLLAFSLTILCCLSLKVSAGETDALTATMAPPMPEGGVQWFNPAISSALQSIGNVPGRALSAGVGLCKAGISRTVSYGIRTVCLPLDMALGHWTPQSLGRHVGLWRYATSTLWSLPEKGFDRERCEVVKVDVGSGNLIIRSNLPLNEEGELQEQAILDHLNEQGAGAGMTLTRENTHWDIYTLQNLMAEHPDWESMQRAVDVRKRPRRYGVEDVQPLSIDFKPHPITGAILPPQDWLPTMVQNGLQRFFPYYLTWTNLPALVEKIRTENTEPAPDGRVRIQLIHCAHGVDRTGLLSASIKMREGTPYQEARIYARRFAQMRTGYNDVDLYAHHGLAHYARWLIANGLGDELGPLEWDYQYKEISVFKNKRE